MLLGLAAAGPSPPAPLPVPPIPPAHPPLDQVAPMPDINAHGPGPENPPGPKLSITDFRLHRYDQSPGYAYGSQFQTNEDKRVIQTPGLTVQVPLQ